jgi:hypothetical protein
MTELGKKHIQEAIRLFPEKAETISAAIVGCGSIFMEAGLNEAEEHFVLRCLREASTAVHDDKVKS